jgi:hypothetical protein
MRALAALLLCGGCWAPWVSGCSESRVIELSRSGTADAGGSEAGPAQGELDIAAPAEPQVPGELQGRPAPPRITPCPAGWLDQAPAGDAPATCVPYPDSASADCGEGRALFPGHADCVTVGTTCPSGDFGSGWSADAPVLFVSATASGGGDGTREAPFASIEQAMAAAPEGDTVLALAKGEYPGPVELEDGITLWGACPSQTVLARPPGERVVVELGREGAHAGMRNLTVRGGLVGIWLDAADAHLELTGVMLRAPTAGGATVRGGATMRAEGVVVRDVVSSERSTVGIEVLKGRLQLHSSVIEDVRGIGAKASGSGAMVVLQDSAIRDVAWSPETGFGHGLLAQLQAQLTVRRSVLERTSRAAVIAGANPAKLTLERTLVRDTRPGGGFGRAVVAEGASELVVRRSVLRDNQGAGLSTRNTPAMLEDLVVQGTEPSSQEGGRGMALAGSEASLSRVWIQDNHEGGLTVSRTALDLSDLTIVGTAPNAQGDLGTGLEVAESRPVRLRRARIEDNRTVGFAARGSTLDIRDVRVRGTRAAPAGRAPRGVGIGTSSGSLRRLHLDDNRRAALLVKDTEELSLADVRVTDVRPGARHGFGRAVESENASLTMSRVLVEDYQDTGIVVSGGEVTFKDVTLRDGMGVPDPTTRPGMLNQGRGIVVTDGATAQLRRIHMRRAMQNGIIVQREGTEARLFDIDVAETRGVAHGEFAGLFGRGLEVGRGARVQVQRARFARSREVGVAAFFEGELTMSDVVVTATGTRDCPPDAPERCSRIGGIGVGSYEDSHVSLTRFRISDNELVGAQFARRGTLALETGIVSNNPIGLNSQNPDVSLDALQRGVRFVGNARNLDATELPVPGSSFR